MLKIFRRIRKNLLNQGKFKNYLVYSVGEIFLVVIGILIALQINNWNDQRKEKEIVKNYLEALKSEYEYNLNKIEQAIMEVDSVSTNARYMIQHTSPDHSNISEKEFGVYAHSINAVRYDPSIGVMNDIISSGKLSYIKNDTLRKYVASWDGLLKRMQNQEELLLVYIQKKNTLIEEHGNVQKAAYYKWNETIRKSSFENSNLPLLKMVQLESLLSGAIGTCMILRNQFYLPLKEELIFYISLIDRELK